MITPQYKRLEIEWKHSAAGDATCERCGNTGEALRAAVEELRQELAPAGVRINLAETLLDKTRIAESNEIRMNGALLEDLLSAAVVSTDCPSCGTLAGGSTCCRAIEISDQRYEDIPPEIFKNAAYRALGVSAPPADRYDEQERSGAADTVDTPKSNGYSCTRCSQPATSCCTDKTAAGTPQEIMNTDSAITFLNRLDHFLARWGVNRTGHIVKPGLYRLGNPAPESPVFASANYTLSFDALRSALAGIDAWILVLDTKGINVWCAAGKGTFGTEELVNRIQSADLANIVTHRKVIVPQLGAPGISWPEVLRRSKFLVEFGPVRACDLPEYLKTRTATPEMRRVEFPLYDRIILTPVELVHAALPTVIGAAVLYFLAGPVAAIAAITAVIGGTVLFPALLPFIPTQDFSTKGMVLGVVLAIPFAVSFRANPALPVLGSVLAATAALLLIPVVVAYLALNFTGCTTFTSRTGVKKEIFRYVPVMAFMAVMGALAGIATGVSRLLGVI